LFQAQDVFASVSDPAVLERASQSPSNSSD
jgi:hypothetical protein